VLEHRWGRRSIEPRKGSPDLHEQDNHTGHRPDRRSRNHHRSTGRTVRHPARDHDPLARPAIRHRHHRLLAVANAIMEVLAEAVGKLAQLEAGER
jgi:hypothetical protein